MPEGEKKRKMSQDIAGSENLDSDGEISTTSDHGSTTNSFKPLYLISEWNEPRTTNRRISVAILLPSGISCGDFSISVHEGGHALNLRVCWPTALFDMGTLHKKWLLKRKNNIRIEAYHPKIAGFESSLKLGRKQASDIIESSSRIPLPFAV